MAIGLPTSRGDGMGRGTREADAGQRTRQRSDAPRGARAMAEAAPDMMGCDGDDTSSLGYAGCDGDDTSSRIIRR